MSHKSNFNELINSETPALVDFYADWCGPCQVMKPVLENLKSKVGDRVKVLKVDVDKNPAVAQSYRIQGVPTLMLFQKGKVLWRQSGVATTDQLVKIINQYAK